MALRSARDALSRVFYQRCFYLFALLLALITVVPFLPETERGRIALNWVNVFLVLATVAAVGRTLLSFVIALLLAAPTVWFQWAGITEHSTELLARHGCSGRPCTWSPLSTSFATCSSRRS